jgi:hypothetical protein
VAALALVVALSAGCFHHTVMVTGAQPASSAERWQHFLIFGLVPLSETWDARTDCQAGIAKVESSMQLGNVLLSAITMGLYASETLKVWCAAPGGAPGYSPTGKSVIIVPSASNLRRLHERFPDLDGMIRDEARREQLAAARSPGAI